MVINCKRMAVVVRQKRLDGGGWHAFARDCENAGYRQQTHRSYLVGVVDGGADHAVELVVHRPNKDVARNLSDLTVRGISIKFVIKRG